MYRSILTKRLMVKVGSGSFRKVKNIHLSRIACLIIAENADGKKPQVQMGREYFKQEISTPESINNSLSANILLYKTGQGESYVLGNSGRTNPLFHGGLCPTAHKPFDYQTFLLGTVIYQS